MISLKNSDELNKMRKACAISQEVLLYAGEQIAPGMSTWELDRLIERFIRSHGAVPNFKGLGGFPGSACISLNNVVIHGIPSKHIIIKEGDIVSIDVGAYLNGYHGDCAATFPCGEISEEAQKLINVTKQSFFEGIKFAHVGCRVSDVGHAVQQYVESFGYGVVRDFVGHGVGSKMHEAPEVPNYGAAGHGARFQPGMVIAVEPMVCAGDWRVKVLKDGWTTVSADGSLTAHYENTILITGEGEAEILTDPGDGQI